MRCFHCDGGLRHWDPHDDPWTEHARWFPRCSYVKLVKGQEFVNACSIEQNSNSNLVKEEGFEASFLEVSYVVIIPLHCLWLPCFLLSFHRHQHKY